MTEENYRLSEAEKVLTSKITVALNHCNLPSWLIASQAYQSRPVPIRLDGIEAWHPQLYSRINLSDDPQTRACEFKSFMSHRFRLPEAGNRTVDDSDPPPRVKLNYRRLLLGWLFDSDNAQGAAWRSWVESRFGLLTCFHGESVSGPESVEYLRFRQQCAKATYNTNELFSQLDLLYGFCQSELPRRYPGLRHLTLYRGCRDLPEHVIDDQPVKLFNNLSSMTEDPESALRFGSKVYEVKVPMEKIVCFESLLPGSLEGEQEFMVLGGLYRVKRVKF